MNIVKPYAKILNIDKYGNHHDTNAFARQDGLALLRKVEWCGRVSHRSEDVMEITNRHTADCPFTLSEGLSNVCTCQQQVREVEEERTLHFIKAVILDHGDWSIAEHANITCDFLVDRGITHEIVRHRHFSFTQESTRFVNYEKKMPPSFIVPYFPSSNSDELINEKQYDLWREGIRHSAEQYKHLIQNGVKPQIARSVFPNALASRIIMTGNLRAWRHFFIMRTSKEAHPQMREVSIPLLEQFQKCIPLLYDDIKPESRQIDNLRMAE